jgi:hypothetical protein
VVAPLPLATQTALKSVKPIVHRLPLLRRLALVTGAFLAVAVPAVHGQVVNPNLGGTTGFDGWDDLTRYNYTGFPSFPGLSGWPGPIDSLVPGSGDAELQRLAVGVSGGPFPADESLYFGSVRQIPNELGGTLRVEDLTPLTDLRTVVFQIQIGEADGHDFHSPGGAPVLKINGHTTGLVSMAPVLLANFQNDTFPSPETGQEEPVYVNTWGFQWDIDPTETVTSLQIDFSAVTHAQIYAMRLDQSTQAYATSVFDGGGGDAEISLPDHIDFGGVTVGASTTRTLTISNTGQALLTVFSLGVPDGLSGDWSGTIAPGASAEVELAFTPDRTGAFAGSISVDSDAANGHPTVPVSGAGIPPAIRMHTVGLPHYDAGQTSVTHRFDSTPGTTLQIHYTDQLADPAGWSLHPSPVHSGHGQFDVTFSKPGDHRAAWARGMFFRLSYPYQP